MTKLIEINKMQQQIVAITEKLSATIMENIDQGKNASQDIYALTKLFDSYNKLCDTEIKVKKEIEAQLKKEEEERQAEEAAKNPPKKVMSFEDFEILRFMKLKAQEPDVIKIDENGGNYKSISIFDPKDKEDYYSYIQESTEPTYPEEEAQDTPPPPSEGPSNPGFKKKKKHWKKHKSYPNIRRL